MTATPDSTLVLRIVNPLYRVVNIEPTNPACPFHKDDMLTIDPDATWTPQRWLVIRDPNDGAERLLQTDDGASVDQARQAGLLLGVVVRRASASVVL